MRDEAFQRITSRAERRARRQKQQEKQQEFLNQGGWLSGVTNGFDELWNTYFGEEVGDNKPKPRETPRRESEATQQEWQFWELAKHEGDEAYLKWMEAHIWTYVGLSAPLLGAVNPLRSVISGENMGLPFTDEIARKLELSKCPIFMMNIKDSFPLQLIVAPVSSRYNCRLWLYQHRESHFVQDGIL
ncbi:MAG UNVERIFIED_CONTAM: hypothetical protein LVR29_20490 [Microcystis novacekii LVE1205-3]